MPKINTPPIPKNKNIMVYMAGFIIFLFALVLVLFSDIVRKPREEREIQGQIAVVEAELKDKQDRLERDSMKAAVDADSYKEKASSFSKQEKSLSEHTMSESEYLKERKWGFWYIVFPAFIIIAIFVIWVVKRHRKWIK